MATSNDIIFFAGIDWEGGNKMPCHHVVERLAKNHRVFYIDNFGGIRDLHWQDCKRAFRKIRARAAFGSRTRRKPPPHGGSTAQKNPQIYVDRPTIVPTPRTRGLQMLNGWCLNRRLKRLIDDQRIRNPVIWTRIPIELVWRAISGVDRSLLLYQMIDKFPDHPKIAPGLRPRHALWERHFTESADLVFASARGLWEEKRRLNPNSHFFPNGVSEIFRRTGLPREPLKERSPVIGFAGAVGTSLDLEWVAELARARPHCRFVLLGTVDPNVDVSILRAQPNIRLEGRVEHETLPEWFSGFDAAFMAYRKNDYQRYTFPSKMAEYLLAGLPVVSNRFPEVEPYSGVVRIVDSPGEMADALDRGVLERCDEIKIAERRKVGENLSWDRIVERMEEVIATKLGEQETANLR